MDMDYNNPNKSGRQAFLQGKALNDNPCGYRTHASAQLEWHRGWLSERKKPCQCIELSEGVYSGCTGLGGDCPECGK